METFLNRRNVPDAAEPSRPCESSHEASAPATDDLMPLPTGDADIVGNPNDMDAALRAAPMLHPIPTIPVHPAGRMICNADGVAFEAFASAGELIALQVFHSFGYEVTLFYHPRSLGCFLTLRHAGALWHALKAADIEAAAGAFLQLEEIAIRLADGEVRCAQLAAHHADLARQIEESEARAEQMRTDLQRKAQQEQEVDRRRHQVLRELAQLEAQRIAAQAQLNKAHRAIHQAEIATNEGLPRLRGR